MPRPMPVVRQTYWPGLVPQVIAVANMAYCYGQLGNGTKAVELYEQVLREVPDHSLAKASLNMLRAVAPSTGAT
jgi:hypothetical protein